MSKNSKRLTRDILSLIKQTEDLEAALRRQKAAMVKAVKEIERGEQSLVEILNRVDWGERRRGVTEASESFEAARHQFRLSMCRLALEQGFKMAELARTLGVSRQLTSKLCLEAVGKRPSP